MTCGKLMFILKTERCQRERETENLFMYGSQHHRMCHEWLAVDEPIRLGETVNVHTKHQLIVITTHKHTQTYTERYRQQHTHTHMHACCWLISHSPAQRSTSNTHTHARLLLTDQSQSSTPLYQQHTCIQWQCERPTPHYYDANTGHAQGQANTIHSLKQTEDKWVSRLVLSNSSLTISSATTTEKVRIWGHYAIQGHWLSHSFPVIVQYWSNYNFWHGGGGLSLTNSFSVSSANTTIAINHVDKNSFLRTTFLSQTVWVIAWQIALKCNTFSVLMLNNDHCVVQGHSRSSTRTEVTAITPFKVI